MLELLLLIIGCYAAAAVLVHLCFRISRNRARAARHYVFVAEQHQQNMEWYLRSLFSFSRWMGKEVRLTVVDRGLAEEEKAIVERWSRSGRGVRLHLERESAQPPENGNGKRYYGGVEDREAHLMWALKAEGVITDAEQAVLIDLQNPSDLSKMPF